MPQPTITRPDDDDAEDVEEEEQVADGGYIALGGLVGPGLLPPPPVELFAAMVDAKRLANGSADDSNELTLP